ncbi:hypothetical protein [Caballeronia sp. BR00000012568055]|uniref:hypothetical protein n=1 Tax=Caballeronia sp. BR00000012568055 TaxID=2918761 RepID=UPI0023F66CEB|nr:hypothetical protein [Caballeronia sp. BR00000012568055]
MTVTELIDTSEQLLEHLQGLIVRSRPPRGGGDRISVGLVLTIAEQFEAALRLTRAQMSTHAATHVRSMIEALVVMKMLDIDAI